MWEVSGPYKAIAALGLGLQMGDVGREICPKCGGGQSREKSLGIGLAEEGYLWWKCHRASCGFSGRRLMWGVTQVAPTKKRASNDFIGALEPLSDVQVKLFEETYGFMVPNGWRFAPEYAKLYCPVLGPRGEYRGAILRNLPGGEQRPKSLTFKATPECCWQDWRLTDGNCGDGIVVVEDNVSAAKVQQSGIPAVALLGTHMGLDKIREILTKTDKINLALDKDAFQKAVNYATIYGQLINITVWKLERDLKYETEERIRRAYFEREADFSSSN